MWVGESNNNETFSGLPPFEASLPPSFWAPNLVIPLPLPNLLWPISPLTHFYFGQFQLWPISLWPISNLTNSPFANCTLARSPFGQVTPTLARSASSLDFCARPLYAGPPPPALDPPWTTSARPPKIRAFLVPLPLLIFSPISEVFR